jgi:hypothetical protein
VVFLFSKKLDSTNMCTTGIALWQGSPHSEDLEKEIRTLRNDLLQVTVY